MNSTTEYEMKYISHVQKILAEEASLSALMYS